MLKVEFDALTGIITGVVADARINIRRTGEGEWRIARFDSKPVFLRR